MIMINIENIENSEPCKLFVEYYQKALKNNQANIEAAVISSFNKDANEVNSRFVNIKYIQDNIWTFFSNYKSTKASDFDNHSQISVLFFWSTINIQIRIKSNIFKSSKNFSDKHYKSRDMLKNVLAHSSMQSKPIESYEKVLEKYDSTLKKNKFSNRPDYWGGYSFTPYYFEFWDGHESRINKREVFEKIDGLWNQSYLQP